MKVLFAASECAPFVKVGGLGDVIGSLPSALIKEGIDARAVIPFYRVVSPLDFNLVPVMEFEVGFRNKRYPVTAYLSYHPDNYDFKVYLLKNEAFLDEGGETAFANTQEEIRTYAFFSQAVVSFVAKLAHWSLITKKDESWVPQIIHCHDWHTGIIPQLIKVGYGLDPQLSKVKTVFTIHNLSYQGISHPQIADALNRALKDAPLVRWDLQDHNVDLLLQGIIGSDIVSTVSPSYAQEIKTEKFGEGLQEVLKSCEGKIRGILNGIDYRSWDPKTDKNLKVNYSFSKETGVTQELLDARAENKRALQEQLNLETDEASFLIGFIGRLDGAQKGLDLMEGLIYKLPQMSLPIQLVILGTGDKLWEERLSRVGREQPNVSVNIKFDSALARLIFGGSDSITMPSSFEPCGLPQMIGMRYGALPIVHAVGGLKDSVNDGVDGFKFNKYSVDDFVEAIKRSYYTYRDKPKWQRMMYSAMSRDFSWNRSAKEYVNLYREVMEKSN
ncbi:hypothetical protein B5M47_02775 [candidate division CPR3 bacterium 4484_211]|uniref:Glycogen synthase n=1 Tax=candidate division CPR3 bacterium 4484_211 TaxID=1968527 RepID=A0A1W9NXZ5_UNCC3|nr:MAG: hypothetical protein B5M47_02775 [candidate division CPR3 bacterium 4484_211]